MIFLQPLDQNQSLVPHLRDLFHNCYDISVQQTASAQHGLRAGKAPQQSGSSTPTSAVRVVEFLSVHSVLLVLLT